MLIEQLHLCGYFFFIAYNADITYTTNTSYNTNITYITCITYNTNITYGMITHYKYYNYSAYTTDNILLYIVLVLLATQHGYHFRELELTVVFL